MKKLILLIMMLQISLFADFISDHEQGWFWYRAAPEGIEKEEGWPEKEDRSRSLTQMSPKEKQEAYKKELENRLAAAWLKPTPSNVQNYQEMQQDMMERSSNFANTWMQNIFLNPELDNTLKNPVNQTARHVQQDLDKERKRQRIHELAKDFGLFFFFGGSCKYCHQFAPIVKSFSERYSWQVLPISIDGKGLKTFPNAKLDNGLFETWGLESLPIVIAVNPKTGQAIPIAQGMISLADMEDRIMLLTEANSHQGELGSNNQRDN
ncbi:MAG: type-F conjugative transfer system pilin assembly protein TraF [Flavobacteriales bacterium]|nr:type-F conjugative transfer system pilin assembly protein TraF [Flavobacteriales bacterium]